MNTTRTWCNLFSVVLVALAIPAPAAGEDEQGSSARSAQHLKPVWYAALDAMYYRYDYAGDVTRDWELNGIRETVVGVNNAEIAADAAGASLLYSLEVICCAGRGGGKDDFSPGVNLLSAGLRGSWGQLTVGKQDSVMSNIGWSVLNPIAGGWGNNFNDLLYSGDPFTNGNGDADEVLGAGSNFFFGYTQTGLIYQYEDENFSVEADYMPFEVSLSNKAPTYGIGGTYTRGDLQLAGAWARQNARSGSVHRRNAVLGGVYTFTPTLVLHLAHMTSKTSIGSAYDITYGGGSWSASDKLSLSALVSRYQQNAEAAQGEGSSRGLSTVIEYVVGKPTLYLSWDSRWIEGGDDGLEDDFVDRARVSNVMVGFHLSISSD